MMTIDILITQPEPIMIVKAIPKDRGLFIPDFSLPDSILSDEVIVEVEVVPELRNMQEPPWLKSLGSS